MIYILQLNLWFYPFLFSFTLIVLNLRLLKLRFIYSILLSILASYFSFLIGWFGWAFWFKIVKSLNISNDINIGNWFYTDIAFCISAFTIAPFLTIYLNGKLFHRSGKNMKFMMLLSILSFIVFSFFYNNMEPDNILNIMNLWYVYFLIVIQLTINLKFTIFKFYKDDLVI